MKTMGERIMERREALGLTRADLARRTGLCVETIRKMEIPRKEPHCTVWSLMLVASALGRSEAELMGGKKKMTRGDAIARLKCYLNDALSDEQYMLEHDGTYDDTDLHELELDIEAYRMAIRALGGKVDP